ncbi:MAG: DoxX family protein [Thermoanaerobaculia bacterium]
MKRYLDPLARFLVALIFILSGVSKIGMFGGVAGMLAAKHVPLAPVALAIAIAIEILGGVGLLLGFHTRIAAGLLIIMLVPTTLLIHVAGMADPAQAQQQLTEVLKNLAIIGALIHYASEGARSFALDLRA